MSFIAQHFGSLVLLVVIYGLAIHVLGAMTKTNHLDWDE